MRAFLEKFATAFALLVLAGVLAIHNPNPPAPTPDPVPSPAPEPTPDAPRPAPAPARPPLVLVLTEYHRTLGPAFASIAQRVRSGEIKDKPALFAALSEHSAALGQTLEVAFSQHADANGAITDAAGLAKVLQQAANGLAK